MSIVKKKQIAREKIIANYESIHNPKCVRALKLIDLMAESNIPVGYWFMKMEGFQGSQRLKDIVDEYIANVDDKYSSGYSICLAGNQGTGKTISAICIIKRALKQDFSAYYITASDMMTEMTNYKSSSDIRNTLRNTDFLVIDELDSRFFVSDAQKELFSSIYENIFRYRTHNTLPTIICTNETNDILNVFYGQSRQAIDSLNKQYLKIYPVAGKDFRKTMEGKR